MKKKSFFSKGLLYLFLFLYLFVCVFSSFFFLGLSDVGSFEKGGLLWVLTQNQRFFENMIKLNPYHT